MDGREDDHSLGTEGSEIPSDKWQVWLTRRFPQDNICLSGWEDQNPGNPAARFAFLCVVIIF